jgi:hypothetical protein
MPCAPNQCLVGRIMNNPSRMPARDSVADKGGRARNNNARVRHCARQICRLFFSSVANLFLADHDSQPNCSS